MEISFFDNLVFDLNSYCLLIFLFLDRFLKYLHPIFLVLYYHRESWINSIFIIYFVLYSSLYYYLQMHFCLRFIHFENLLSPHSYQSRSFYSLSFFHFNSSHFASFYWIQERNIKILNFLYFTNFLTIYQFIFSHCLQRIKLCVFLNSNKEYYWQFFNYW